MISISECEVLVKNVFNQKNCVRVLNHNVVPLELHGINSSYFLLKILVFNTPDATESNLALIGKWLDKDSSVALAPEIDAQKWACSTEVIPKIYWSNGSKVIVFENFIENGYVAPLNSKFDIYHIEVVLAALAKFHVASINSNKNLRPKSKNINVWIDIGLSALSSLLGNDFHNNLKHLYVESLNALRVLNTSETVLCHGYMWGNNVVFQYKESKPISCKFLNLELLHANYPAYDVLHFLYRSTTSEMRQKHFHQFVEYYYNCIEKEFIVAGLENILLKENFLKSVHYLIPIVKIESACFRLIDFKSLDRSVINVLKEDLRNDPVFSNSITDLVRELPSSSNCKITIEDCYQIIRNAAGTDDYTCLNYDIKPLGEMKGYLGEHCKLTVSILLNRSKTNFYFFCKFTPKSDAARTIFHDIDAFAKEVFIYKVFIPALKRLNSTAISECTVPCYFSRENDVLVFEDLAYLGYKSLDPRKHLPYETVILVLKKLATFHASSILFEETMTKTMDCAYNLKEHFYKNLQETLFLKTENHQGARVILTGIASIEFLLDMFPTKDPLLANEKILTKVKASYDKMFELVKESKEFRNVICHGDLWINNILVQHVDGVPKDCRLIDFQVIRYCPPAVDILAFLHVCTNRLLRETHFNEIVAVYYEELKLTLKNHGYDVATLYPYSVFIKSLQDLKLFAICQAPLYFQLCLINQEIFKKVMVNEETFENILLKNRNDYIKIMYDSDDLFRHRMAEAIQELREMCLVL